MASVAQAMCAQGIGSVLVRGEGGESMRVVRADTPFVGRAGEHADLLLRAA
ncbi:hypothetical protein AB0D11_46925 [Streptomyces monashensis]|uniref:hypothetical protein n=1 Tax=Streptomyces monashensis TaxID=1678012 RepID=UPI0033FF8385